MAKLEVRKKLAVAVAAAEEKQAVDLRILELDPSESGLTDYFLVMSGTNSRQMQTLADEIELQLKRQFGDYANSREGYRQGEWILLDYVDFVVHIFSEEKRAFYDIERLRKSAHVVSPDELRAALVEKTARVRQKAAAGGSEAAGIDTVGTETVGKKAVGSNSVGKKTAGSRTVSGMPLGAKSVGSKGLGKKSAPAKAVGKKSSGGKTAGRKPVGKKKAVGKSGGVQSKPVVRGKNKLKATPKSTPKSRKRS